MQQPRRKCQRIEAPGQEHHRQQQQQVEADEAITDPSLVWLEVYVDRFADFLSLNEVACVLRLVNKATAEQFSDKIRAEQNKELRTTTHLSQPRRQLPRLTACSGSIANLEVLRVHDDVTTNPLSYEVFEAAAGAGRLEVCRWLAQQRCPSRSRKNESVLSAAAQGGHTAVCEWLLANGCSPGDRSAAAAAAARAGHIRLMDWLLSGLEPGVHGLLVAAAEGCDLPTLQGLHRTHRTSGGLALAQEQIQMVASAAASSTADYPAKVKWLEGQGCPRHPKACLEVTRVVDGRDRLQWLQERGYDLEFLVADAAARYGNTKALKFVLKTGGKLGTMANPRAIACEAAAGGHLSVLMVLRGRKAPMGHDTAAAAAAGGHLRVVKWLAETLGVALHADVFTSAAKSGSMELLEWLRKRGCPWDAPTFAAAAEAGCEEQLEWLAVRADKVIDQVEWGIGAGL
ncbi:hypothetical protein TSOC_005822 [Tetrabaena socialis]|uniref:Uncharacterized protein n=1 Tax=Tetrabaena socialis TaxID=47790 RepID=A0A2J8A5A6_9CHLO|nr:hypothetical protein TSOC_005822 [Tetrabaena socialis]|eukprot:PNH07685.1 hypothetical protein TSOC_005822 [Tetrabaena socialis]